MFRVKRNSIRLWISGKCFFRRRRRDRCIFECLFRLRKSRGSWDLRRITRKLIEVDSSSTAKTFKFFESFLDIYIISYTNLWWLFRLPDHLKLSFDSLVDGFSSAIFEFFEDFISTLAVYCFGSPGCNNLFPLTWLEFGTNSFDFRWFLKKEINNPCFRNDSIPWNSSVSLLSISNPLAKNNQVVEVPSKFVVFHPPENWNSQK